MKKGVKIFVAVVIAFALVLGYMFLSGNVGVTKGKIEKDARKSQQIPESSFCQKADGKEIVGMIFYDEDYEKQEELKDGELGTCKATFSVYIKHKFPSIGWFFRAGGSISEIDDEICLFNFSSWNLNERLFLSLNKQKAETLKYKDFLTEKEKEIALGGKPFALCFEKGYGDFEFFNEDGKKIETIERKM